MDMYYTNAMYLKFLIIFYHLFEIKQVKEITKFDDLGVAMRWGKQDVLKTYTSRLNIFEWGEEKRHSSASDYSILLWWNGGMWPTHD